MAARRPSSNRLFFFFFFFQLLVLIFCNTVTSSDVPHTKDFEVVWEKEQLFPSIHRALMEYFRSTMTKFDSIDPPTTALPSAPITNPVTTPAVNNAPGIITVPGTTPATNPVNPPVPVSNPVTTPSANPPPTSSGGNGRGQSWCIAKNGASQAALQSALDYACGIGGADCATIQQGSSCYEPATLQNHASYAFNSYYQKNPVPTSCDFAGAAALTTTNPSTGSCVYPSSSSSTSSPTTPVTQAPPTTPVTQAPPTTPVTQAPPTKPITQAPPTTPMTQAPPTTPMTQAPPTTPITQAPVNPTSLPAPTTSSSYSGSTSPGTQSPPPGFSFENPDPTGLGAYGASPPLVNTASVVSNNLVGSLVIVASIIMFGLFDC